MNLAAKRLKISLLAFVLAPVTQGWANPTGGTVVSGSATFANSGSTLTVTNAPNTIINWQGFSINAGETTRFVQPSSSSAVLNRVTTQNASSILGSLQSNGRVFLVNPNGILLGAGAQINTATFTATTVNFSDSAFLSGSVDTSVRLRWRTFSGLYSPGMNLNIQADGRIDISVPNESKVYADPNMGATSGLTALAGIVIPTGSSESTVTNSNIVRGKSSETPITLSTAVSLSTESALNYSVTSTAVTGSISVASSPSLGDSPRITLAPAPASGKTSIAPVTDAKTPAPAIDTAKRPATANTSVALNSVNAPSTVSVRGNLQSGGKLPNADPGNGINSTASPVLTSARAVAVSVNLQKREPVF